MGNNKLIFVFGSNLDGYHGAGAARTARLSYGAKMGVGEGLTGQCYALPTKGHRLSYMPLDTVEKHVHNFLALAEDRQDLGFKVTRVGCGLAGFRDNEIAPLFRGAPRNCLFDTIWQSELGDGYLYWGHVG